MGDGGPKSALELWPDSRPGSGRGRRAGEAPALGGPREGRRNGRGWGGRGGKAVVAWKEKERSDVGVESSITAVLLLLLVAPAAAEFGCDESRELCSCWYRCICSS